MGVGDGFGVVGVVVPVSSSFITARPVALNGLPASWPVTLSEKYSPFSLVLSSISFTVTTLFCSPGWKVSVAEEAT